MNQKVRFRVICFDSKKSREIEMENLLGKYHDNNQSFKLLIIESNILMLQEEAEGREKQQKRSIIQREENCLLAETDNKTTQSENTSANLIDAVP